VPSKRLRAVFYLSFAVAAGYASGASAGMAECKKIEVPLDRLACFDRLTNKSAAAQPAKPSKLDLRPAEPRQISAAYTKVPPLIEPPGKRWWVEAEQGFYGLSRGHAPALIVTGNPTVIGPVVTTAPIPTAPGFIGLRTEQNFLGPLANGGTLFGGGGLDTSIHSAEALRFGYWLDPGHTQAIEGGAFYIGRESASFNSVPGGNAVGIPFFDANGVGQTYFVNRPTTLTTTTVFVNTTPGVFVHLFDTVSSDQATGSAGANYSNSLWSADLNYRLHTPFLRERGASIDVTAGVKYVNLTETLSIGSSVSTAHSDVTTFEPALGLPGTPGFTNSTNSTTVTSDTVRARNNFIGPQVGMRGDYRFDNQWSITGDARLAIGANIETLSVSGSTVSNVSSTATPTTTLMLAGIPLMVANGTPVTTTTTNVSGNGIFASAANSGNHSRTVFSFIPSGTFKLNYDVLPNFLTLSLGYNVFWISDVLRASNQLTGVGAPTYEQSSLLAQGVTLSAKVKF
jgi:Putative beta barrel porin-7 (BBP7)